MLEKNKLTQKLSKQKAMLQDDITVALLGKHLILSIRDEIEKMESEDSKMGQKENKLTKLERENRIIKSKLLKLMSKVEFIMNNDNIGADIFALGVMISDLKKEFSGE